MKYPTIALLAVMPALAQAQTAPTPPAGAPAAVAPASAPVVGASVTGRDNQPVGTIAAVTAQAVTIDTGTNKVPVPPASIGTSAKGPTIAMTKAELDAAFAQAAQQARASLKLTPGTTVNGLNGTALGTIKAADAQFVTLTTAKGDVKLPVNGFGPGPNGAVTLGLTAAQLDAAMAGNAPAAGSPQP